MKADGSSVRQLTNHPAHDFYPDWSPDGRNLVFWSKRSGRDELYVISTDRGDLEGEIPRLLAEGVFPKWSPDGGLIAFKSRDGLGVIPPEGGDARLIVQGKGTQNVPIPWTAAWSSDSRTLFYKAEEADGTASFWSVTVSGGEPKLLVRFDDPSRLFIRDEFSSDGKRFFFPLTEYESDIWVAQLEER